jgi:hypothetical protein
MQRHRRIVRVKPNAVPLWPLCSALNDPGEPTLRAIMMKKCIVDAVIKLELGICADL